MTAVETIREAAALMRERAEAATQGRWESLERGDRLVAWRMDPSGEFDDDFEYVVDEPMSNGANAEHIASWDPAVALAVADMLDAEARAYEVFVGSRRAVGDVRPEVPETTQRALTAALAYLGRTS